MFDKSTARFAEMRIEIPSAPCRLYVASASGGQCSTSVKAGGKTVYNQEKHALRTAGISYQRKRIPFG